MVLALFVCYFGPSLGTSLLLAKWSGAVSPFLALN